MSLINQVLNDLEKRGASTAIGEATVRVVPLRQRHGGLWLTVAVVSISILAVSGWLKWEAEIRVDAPVKANASVPPLVQPPMNPPSAQGGAEASAIAGVDAAPAAKALALKPPSILSVNPNPVISLGVPQAVMIVGEYFSADVLVNLRTPTGKIYANRQIVMQDATKIVINPNFGDLAGTWTVEVANASGSSAGQFEFSVQALAAVAGIEQKTKPAASKKSAETVAKPAPEESLAVLLPVGGVSKQPTQITPHQQAENAFRKAYALQQQGQSAAAISGYEAALKLDAAHLVARQTLVHLLLESRRNEEAERLLQEGLQQDPGQPSLAILLARIQVGRNELEQALETMQRSLPYAQQQADYQAFVAALLQRQNKHKEAIIYFRNAVLLSPQSGVWQMGLGISLRAEQRNEESRDAFRRALESHSLSAELNTFVSQQLKEL